MSELKKVLGFKVGDFTTDQGEKVHFTHLYVCCPKEGVIGLSVDIFKCLNDNVIEGIKPGDYVKAYFNENKKVQLLVQEEPKEDLSVFSDVISIDEAIFVLDKFDKQSEEQPDEQTDEQTDKKPEG